MLSPRDGHLLISGSADGTIKLWDWNKLKEQSAPSPIETTLGLSFSPDSTLNLAEVERETRVQSVPVGRILTTLSITNADFSPDGRLIVGLNNGSIEVFDQKTFKHLDSVFSGQHLRGPVVFSPVGSLLVGQSSNVLELLNPRQKWERQMRWEVPFSPNGAAFSDDGKYLAAVGPEQRLAVFSMETGRPVREFRPETADGMARLWKPVWIAGTHILASISGEIVVYLWNVDDNLVRRLKPGVGNTWALAASPDGRTLAIGTQDGFIQLINIATSREMATLRGHLTNIHGVSFSPNGTMLISTGGEGSRLWSARDFPQSLGSIR